MTAYESGLPAPIGKRASWRDPGGFPFDKVNPPFIIRYLKQVSKSLLYIFVPQLIRTNVFDDEPEQHGRKSSATAWMDGLRGLAALAVFNLHFFYNFTYTVARGYGNKNSTWIHQIPVLCLFCDGTTSVVIFFTIAGYVTSYKALQYITTKDHEGLFKSMPASVFRKWFRLYLPVACSTLTFSIVAYLGLLEPSRYLYDGKTNAPLKKYMSGPGTEPLLPQLPTLYLQLHQWIAELIPMMNFWTEYPRDPKIDFHLWTIVYEFRSCMHLFVALLALAGCGPRVRISFLVFLGILQAYCCWHWEEICFFCGAALAQMEVLRQLSIAHGNIKDLSTDTFPLYGVASFRRGGVFKSQPVRTLGYCLVLYLASFPYGGAGHGGGIFYNSIVNPLLPKSWPDNRKHKFPKQIAVLLFMLLLLTTPAEKRSQSRWHRLLTSKVVLYLGKIMFALYLMHGLILHMIGYGIPFYVWRRTCSTWDEEVGIRSVTNNLEFLFGVLTGWTVSLVLTLWAADVWEREVERRCTRLTKWIEYACFDRDEPVTSCMALPTPLPRVPTNAEASSMKVH